MSPFQKDHDSITFPIRRMYCNMYVNLVSKTHEAVFIYFQKSYLGI